MSEFMTSLRTISFLKNSSRPCLRD